MIPQPTPAPLVHAVVDVGPAVQVTSVVLLIALFSVLFAILVLGLDDR